MLQESLFESAGGRKRRHPVTTAASIVVHAAIVLMLIVVPLFQTQALTIPPVDTALFLPKISGKPYITVLTPKPRSLWDATSAVVAPTSLMMPERIPTAIISVDEPGPIGSGVFSPFAGAGFGFTLGDDGGGGPGGLHPSGLTQPPPPPPPPTPPPPPPLPAAKTEVLRISGGAQAARLIHQVNPDYPEIAKRTRVQGVVVLDAIINKEGAVESLRVVSGHLLLNQAAIDAVRQWRYQPTLLNSEPVEVATTITVTFTLR
jgi:protein TonB